MNQSYFTNNNTVFSDRVIYTPSTFARSSLLYLQEIGNLQALRPHTSSRAELSSYLFFIVNNGYGTLSYNNQVYNLSQGSCVFIDCELPYSHSTGKENISDENLWSLQWCHFNGPEMKGIYEKYKSRGGPPVFNPSEPGVYQKLLESLQLIASSSSYVRDMKINAELSQLLVLLMEAAWNPGGITEKQSVIRNIREYLDDKYAERITLDRLSNIFFIDKFYLCEQFKEQMGVSVMDYLISVRITEAKKMLRFTDKSIEEISEAVGVNGGAYFSRMFKKVEGISPSEYRKMW